MSQENVQVVRRSLEAFGRNDWEAALAECDPGIEWIEMPSLGPDASTYRGTAEVRVALESWIAMWSEYDLEVCRYADVADEVVLLVRERGSGDTSGAGAEREVGDVFTVRGGKIIRARLYGSWSEALEAAGLSE